MSAADTLRVSPFRTVGRTIGWSLCLIGLIMLYFSLFALGGGLVAPYLPATPTQPGPVPEMTGLLIVCAATVLIIMSMIHSADILENQRLKPLLQYTIWRNHVSRH